MGPQGEQTRLILKTDLPTYADAPHPLFAPAAEELHPPLAAVRLATGSQRCFAALKCASAAVQAKLHGSSRDSGVQPQQEFEYGPSGPRKGKRLRTKKSRRRSCSSAGRAGLRAQRAPPRAQRASCGPCPAAASRRGSRACSQPRAVSQTPFTATSATRGGRAPQGSLAPARLDVRLLELCVEEARRRAREEALSAWRWREQQEG